MFLPVLPCSREALRKGRCRVEGGDARCCQPGGAGGRGAATRGPQAPWLAVVGGAGGPVCSVSRGRTRVRWMHSPTPFSVAAKLMWSRETESRFFPRCTLTDQALSKKSAAAAGAPLGSVTGGRRSWHPSGKPCPKLQLWSVFLNASPEVLPDPRILWLSVRR